MNKNTIVVNLFGGPGTGKSTGAAYVFSQLKLHGIDCELVTEFAKDKVWEKNEKVFNCQMYVTGKQTYKIMRVYGEVDVIITDSPILLGAAYTDSEKLKSAIVEEFNNYRNINIFLNRVKEYNPNGRHQNEDEAKAIDGQMLDLLNTYCSTFGTPNYYVVDGNESGYNKIVQIIENFVE